MEIKAEMKKKELAKPLDGEQAKIEQLSRASNESGEKRNPDQTRDTQIADRLAQQKEVKLPQKENPGSEKMEKAKDLASQIESVLNPDAYPISFGASQGTCRRERINQHYCGYAGF